MKLAMLRTAGAERPAVLIREGLAIDLSAAAAAGLLEGPAPRTLVPLLDPAGAGQAAARRVLDVAASDSGLDRLTAAGAIRAIGRGDLAPPVRPRLILACGMAYKDHLEEMRVTTVPTEPSGFVKSANAVIGPDEAIVLPAVEPEMVDFECELSVVFGRRCHAVSEAEALSCVAGYTMVNDVGSRVGVREWTQSLRGTDHIASANFYHRFIRGKQFPTFCPLGPVVTTADEITDLDDVDVGTRLNGRTMQASNTRNLIFPIAASIAYFSHWFEFRPGDVLTTGSPAGVGFAHSPPIFMQPGDVVEVHCGAVGSLSNPVVAAS